MVIVERSGPFVAGAAGCTITCLPLPLPLPLEPYDSGGVPILVLDS